MPDDSAEMQIPDDDTAAYIYIAKAKDPSIVIALVDRMRALKAENTRMADANLLRAVVAQRPQDDLAINDYINADDFDRVPWLVAQKATDHNRALQVQVSSLEATILTQEGVIERLTASLAEKENTIAFSMESIHAQHEMMCQKEKNLYNAYATEIGLRSLCGEAVAAITADFGQMDSRERDGIVYRLRVAAKRNGAD